MCKAFRIIVCYIIVEAPDTFLITVQPFEGTYPYVTVIIFTAISYKIGCNTVGILRVVAHVVYNTVFVHMV